MELLMAVSVFCIDFFTLPVQNWLHTAVTFQLGHVGFQFFLFTLLLCLKADLNKYEPLEKSMGHLFL